jgi:type 2 lantibiotic biosynthesis protein LanM
VIDRFDQLLPAGPGPHARDDLRWHAGLTLAERLVAMNLVPSGGRRGRQPKPDRTIRWRVEQQADIARVKKHAAISLDAPPWLRTFRTAYTEAERGKPLGGSPRGFLASIEPLLAKARHNINAAIEGSAAGFCPTSEENRAALVASFEISVRKRLYDTLSKTLVLELAVASQRNILSGNSPEERFTFFCNCLAEPDFARALLEQYPVLVRRVATITSNWQTATLALLSRLAGSLPTLHQKFFNGDDPGPLAAVETSGDTHCNGQAVHILSFAAGQRLVYKPRSVAMESCFFDLVGWLNRYGCEPDLKEVRALDEVGFGWMEFVEAKPCQTKDQVERFFIRQGAQIALAYTLGGTDLHYENVIAHGEYPVLVDLETLFQTPLLPNGFTGATVLGCRALQTSIMGTSLLPEPTFMAGDQNWIDISALGHHEGQLTPFRVPVWRAAGTDQMRLLHERVPVAGGVSLPEYNELRTQATAYVDLVVDGFERVYELLRKHRTQLLSEHGPLASCLGKPVRHVFRNTGSYAVLLDASHHPRFLTDAVGSEAFLHNRLKTESKGSPFLAAIEDEEVVSLLSGNIPYFVSRVGERAILAEGKTMDHALSGDGWQECRVRIEAMSDADLDRQKWFARVAMADLSAPADGGTSSRTGTSRDPSLDELISTATCIGERICDIAITDGERATWLVPELADTSRLLTTVADHDLYGGLSGIALFLGHLGSITGESRFRCVAIAAMSEALAVYEAAGRDISRPATFGAFDGAGGLAYALMQLASLVDRPDWLGDAVRMLKRATRQAGRSSQLDIVSGQAGLMVATLAVHRNTNDAALISGLRPLAQTLRQLATAPGKRAESLLPAKADAGLAHGRAGIGFALSRWAEATGDEGFHAPATDLIRFDLEAIDAMRPKPSGLNQLRERKVPHLGWCRGSLGVALSVLQAKPVSDSIKPSQGAWFQRIADEIIDRGVEGPLCLCHGALARMEFLATAEERGVLNNVDDANAWRRLLITRLLSGDWVADDAHSLESPSLMVGLAGTGYALLRASYPQRVPSVLTVEPPSETNFRGQ